MMQKTITLTANKAELTFEVTTDKYNKYINELSLSNKIAPAHNFLMRCVVEDSRPALKELLEQPGFAVQIASFVVEEFQPDLTLGQLMALCHRWFPGRQEDEDCMAEALFLELDYWEKMGFAVANGIARAFGRT